MRVTVIKSDGMVSVDGVAYTGLDLSMLPSNLHAVQWYGNSGEVEFATNFDGVKPSNVIIQSLDSFSEAIAAWTYENNLKLNPPPVSDTVKKLECKRLANAELQSTDWTQLSDVSAILININEFNKYRAYIRVYATDPVTDPIWPTKPTAVWVSN